MPFLSGFRMTETHSKDYFNALPVVRSLKSIDMFRFNSPVTFFVGENGSGKSTLMEALAVAAGLNAEGGSRNFNFATKRTESGLHHHIQLARSARERDGYFLRAESYYNVASHIDYLDEMPAFAPPLINSYGGTSLHAQSHGESFMALIQNRLRCGLYFFDEPEAALSPTRQMTLLVEIDRLVKAGSQLIIATHSPILLAYPGADIYEISEEGIVLTPYTETAHYSITKRFLNDTPGMLRRLLED
ncbi:MAG: AAA family ATPase [Oscillospiraceae bacterium]|nr:AAA family ATPase [Oscillospiraceae bacterium]